MRVIGIDPGTKSFDIMGIEDEKIILDLSIPSIEVAQNPERLINIIEPLRPIDIIVGPSGYGLPLTPIQNLTQKEISLILPPEEKRVSVNEGIIKLLNLMKQKEFPVYFTPGVIHLTTVPLHRKINKMDMGTADKVCSVALAMKDEAELKKMDYKDTSFILVETGYAFTSVIGVKKGKIVDGIGGSSGGPGFLSLGALDSDLATRLHNFTHSSIFTGGAKYACGEEEITPQKLAKYHKKYLTAWNMLIESVVKSVAMINISTKNSKEILLSGRLAQIPEITRELQKELSSFGSIRDIRRGGEMAKEAAEGACIIGNGLLGGKYKGIVDSLKLREAKGTIYDYIYFKEQKL